VCPRPRLSLAARPLKLLILIEFSTVERLQNQAEKG
jgi:hypothetical protein